MLRGIYGQPVGLLSQEMASCMTRLQYPRVMKTGRKVWGAGIDAPDLSYDCVIHILKVSRFLNEYARYSIRISAYLSIRYHYAALSCVFFNPGI